MADAVCATCEPPWKRCSFVVVLSFFMVVLTTMSAVGLEVVSTGILLSAFALMSFYSACFLSTSAKKTTGRNEITRENVADPLIGGEKLVDRDEDEESNLAQVSVDDVGSAGGTKKDSPRFYFLDNLKSVLTALVVYHHATCSVSGGGWIYNIGNFNNDVRPILSWTLIVDQSYFMCLFFFMSGYFTSSSMRKKGRMDFLYDKFKRIGVPLTLWSFIFGPLVIMMVVGGFLERPPNYFPSPLQCWYLAWLLLLSCFYCFFYDEGRDKVPPRDIYPPTLLFMLGVAVTACFIVNTALMFLNVGTIFSMPISFGSLPFDVAAFFGGAILEHRKTLSNLAECLKNERVAFEANLAKIGAAVTIVGSFIAIEVTWYYDNGGILNPEDMSTTAIITTILLWSFFLSAGMVCMCYSAIVFSFELFNYKTAFTAMLARAAYAVYIIHPPIVCLVTYSWVQILASTGIYCEFPVKDGLSSATPMPTGLIFAGWIYCVCMSELITWPLAHYFRQLPLVKDYL